jgi:gliding motility-associated-like protein
MFTASGTGTAVITYSVGPDANGCSSLSTFLLTVITRPFTAGGSIAPISCYGAQNASITATPTGAPYIYLWSTGSTAPAVAALTPGNYSLIVTDTTNRCTDTTTFAITQPDSLIAFSTTTPDICSTASGSITTSISGGTTPYTYLWAHSNATTPTLSALSAGSYTLTLSDANGCTLLLTTTIIDSACTGIVINTGISPNGDGINDTWIIEGLFPYADNTVQIFDKWGDMVFERTNYQNDWSGTGKNGTLLPDGSYFYLLKLNTQNKTGGDDIFKGTLMIKR